MPPLSPLTKAHPTGWIKCITQPPRARESKVKIHGHLPGILQVAAIVLPGGEPGFRAVCSTDLKTGALQVHVYLGLV